LNDLGPKLEEAEVHLTSESETEFELLRHLHGDCSPELEKAEVDLASESETEPALLRQLHSDLKKSGYSDIRVMQGHVPHACKVACQRVTRSQGVAS